MELDSNCGKNVKLFRSDAPFRTEQGTVIDSLVVAYHTYGTMSPSKDNVLWICHALTANSDVADWWSGLFGEGKLYDPAKYYIVCANKLGSQYGSTSPLNTPNCPTFSIRDNVEAFRLLAAHLGIGDIRILIGGSTGGAQALEWAIMEPDRIKNLGVIASLHKTSTWITAFSETQKMAIEAAKDEKSGLAVARAISMMLYRGPLGYNMSQTPESVGSYQVHQGDKFARRYNSACYLQMLATLLTHDVSRGRGSTEEVLQKIKAKAICVAIDTDLAFPFEEIEQMANMIPDGSFRKIHSDYGHDGFLLEFTQITNSFKPIFSL